MVADHLDNINSLVGRLFGSFAQNMAEKGALRAARLKRYNAWTGFQGPGFRFQVERIRKPCISQACKVDGNLVLPKLVATREER